MSPSLRFLGLVLCGWAGVRAATLGVLPGAEIFQVDQSLAKPTPIVPTQFPPIDPPPADAFYAADEAALLVPAAAAVPPSGAYYRPVPPSVSASPLAGRAAGLAGVMPEPRPAFYSPIPPLDEWPLSRIAAASMPPIRSSVTIPAQSIPAGTVRPSLDRLQLTSWALLRGRQGLQSGPSGIASGGTLGASQAGARLTYNVTRQIAATLRSSTEVGRRGGEVAAGVRVQPVPGIPVWVNAERRMALGKYGGGRNAFALFLEGGVYDRTMPWRFKLDAYLQGGVVGMHRRDKFIDGALTLTRPIYRNFWAGLGVWGGAQPGLYRVDAGPRVTMKLRDNVKIHLDYRQKLAGNAQPGSGPVVTLAGDF